MTKPVKYVLHTWVFWYASRSRSSQCPSSQLRQVICYCCVHGFGKVVPSLSYGELLVGESHALGNLLFCSRTHPTNEQIVMCTRGSVNEQKRETFFLFYLLLSDKGTFRICNVARTTPPRFSQMNYSKRYALAYEKNFLRGL